MISALLIAIALFGFVCQQQVVALTPAERAQAMLDQMTLSEKLTMM
jgi:hypothetical protein